MGVLSLLHAPGRYDNLRRIRSLDPEVDHDEILHLTAHAALRRLNRIHGHYDIPDHELAYVLATTIVGPVRWIEAYGWRRLDARELAAITKVTTRFDELNRVTGTTPGYGAP